MALEPQTAISRVTGSKCLSMEGYSVEAQAAGIRKATIVAPGGWVREPVRLPVDRDALEAELEARRNRRRRSGLSENEVQLLFIELTYGKSLANEVRRWEAEQAA